mmetsp:Transcript_34843/g.86446  ORF Transcript_34843/g.86446 Transcript_34843/m.86446 type:complete len:223 (+) Transcript_34843:148-816(+)
MTDTPVCLSGLPIAAVEQSADHEAAETTPHTRTQMAAMRRVEVDLHAGTLCYPHSRPHLALDPTDCCRVERLAVETEGKPSRDVGLIKRAGNDVVRCDGDATLHAECPGPAHDAIAKPTGPSPISICRQILQVVAHELPRHAHENPAHLEHSYLPIHLILDDRHIRQHHTAAPRHTAVQQDLRTAGTDAHYRESRCGVPVPRCSSALLMAIPPLTSTAPAVC